MIQFYAVDGPVTNDHNLNTYLFDPTLLEAESELHTVHFAAPEGEDRGADEVAAGAGPERQQGRQPRSPPLSTSFPLSLASSTSPSPPLLLLPLFAPSISSFRSPAEKRAFPTQARARRPTGTLATLPAYAIGWQR